MTLALTDAQRRLVLEVLAEHAPAGATARAFGSRVKTTHRPFSDLDIALFAREPLTLSQLGELKDAFSESDLPFRVDVVDGRTASPFLQAVIARDGVDLTPPGAPAANPPPGTS